MGAQLSGAESALRSLADEFPAVIGALNLSPFSLMCIFGGFLVLESLILLA